VKAAVKRLGVAVLCMALGSTWAQQPDTAAKPLARFANGEVVSEKDLADYLGRRMITDCP